MISYRELLTESSAMLEAVTEILKGLNQTEYIIKPNVQWNCKPAIYVEWNQSPSKSKRDRYNFMTDFNKLFDEDFELISSLNTIHYYITKRSKEV
jgi:hypothetical protein